MNALRWIAALLMLSLPQLAIALPWHPEEDELHIRVVDVGAGLCCIVRIPGNHYMIFDAGLGKNAIAQIKHCLPKDEALDLLVLSHADADHIGAVPEICDWMKVKRVLRGGSRGSTWNAANDAVLVEPGCEDLDLHEDQNLRIIGNTYELGDATVTVLSGFDVPPDWFGMVGSGEKNNGGSICVRLEYAGSSVLFMGDAVGRHRDDAADDALIGTECYLVYHQDERPIDSDVLIASHHGGNNGSSGPFIKSVSPEYVIFSSGHDNSHPSSGAAKRVVRAGVLRSKIFRTDPGDDEGYFEWDGGRIAGHTDAAKMDHVDIVIKSNGKIVVRDAPEGTD